MARSNEREVSEYFDAISATYQFAEYANRGGLVKKLIAEHTTKKSDGASGKGYPQGIFTLHPFFHRPGLLRQYEPTNQGGSIQADGSLGYILTAKKKPESTQFAVAVISFEMKASETASRYSRPDALLYQWQGLTNDLEKQYDKKRHREVAGINASFSLADVAVDLLLALGIQYNLPHVGIIRALDHPAVTNGMHVYSKLKKIYDATAQRRLFTQQGMFYLHPVGKQSLTASTR